MTKEYVRVPVSAREAGVSVDPTAFVVEMAFVAPGSEPEVADWNAAAWETEGSLYFARALADNLVNGSYRVWIRISAGAEVVVREAGPLRVT